MPADDDEFDDRFAAMFGAAGRDGPAPDREFLARLRERSLSAFLEARPVASSPAASEQPSCFSGELSTPEAASTTPRPVVSPRLSERRPMLLAVRALVTCVVVLFGLASWLDVRPPAPQAKRGPTFDVVLRNTVEGENYKLAFHDYGLEKTVYRFGENLRIDNPDNSFVISNGRTEWYVNEADNVGYARPAEVNADASGNELLGILDPTVRLGFVPPAEPQVAGDKLVYLFAVIGIVAPGKESAI